MSSDFDYSKLSNEELMKLASSSPSDEESNEQPGLFRSAIQGYGNYAKGFARGGAQALGDIGASAVNWPIEGLEHLSGKKIPHVPHPHLTRENPRSFGESLGQNVGSLLPLVISGFGGAGAAGLVGKNSSTLAKLLAGGAGGALTGAAENEGERLKGSVLGALGGVLGAGLPMVPHLTKRGASKKLNLADKLARERNVGKLDIDRTLIKDVKQFLPNTEPYRKLLKAAEKRQYPNLFDLQSDVGKHAGEYSKSWFSKAERLHGREGLKARQRLIEATREALRKEGHHDIADLMQEGQRDYRRHMAINPYIKWAEGLGVTGAVGSVIPHDTMSHILSKLLLRKSD